MTDANLSDPHVRPHPPPASPVPPRSLSDTREIFYFLSWKGVTSGEGNNFPFFTNARFARSKAYQITLYFSSKYSSSFWDSIYIIASKIFPVSTKEWNLIQFITLLARDAVTFSSSQRWARKGGGNHESRGSGLLFSPVWCLCRCITCLKRAHKWGAQNSYC